MGIVILVLLAVAACVFLGPWLFAPAKEKKPKLTADQKRKEKNRRDIANSKGRGWKAE